MAELVFAQELLVALGDKTALALHGADKPELLQVGVGALGGDDADAQLFGQKPDAGQCVPRAQCTGQNLLLDLPRNLRVNRLLPGIG